MINLAAFRYRNVLVSSGGPVERIEVFDLQLQGQRLFQANAYLRKGLAASNPSNGLYCDANGSGTAASAMVARHMAISEAMERWAHWQLYASPEGRDYGFTEDPSSNGMAAYPGVFAKQARSSALFEAAERYNLLHWWEGLLPAHESGTSWPGVRAVTICSVAPGVTVILFKRAAEGFFAYGHAAAKDWHSACHKALIELDRHEIVVRGFSEQHAGRTGGELPLLSDTTDRRALFFSRDEGHELFLERLRSRPLGTAPPPQLIFDGAIPGPWSRYADVWRVVYAPPSDRFLGNEANYFMW